MNAASFRDLDALLSGGGTRRPWCPHRPHPRQQDFLDLACSEALYGGAAGGGKSDALLMAALQYVDVPGYSAILFRRTYTDLALPGAIMDRAHEWLDGSTARWAERDKTWHFPSGATVAFGYVDGPRDHLRYQGAEFQFVGFDELTQFVERSYLYLFSRLRRCAGSEVPLRMRSATNPGDIGHEWVKRRFLLTPEDRVFVPAKLEDNPSLDREQYESALARLDPITRRQLRDGDWVRDTSGLVYHLDPDRTRAHALPRLRDGEAWQYVLGIDYGHTDATALVELAFAEHEAAIYVTRSQAWTGLTPSDAAEVALAWDRERGGYDRIVGDMGGLGKGYAEEARQRFGLPVEPAQKADKMGYIRLLNGDFHHGRVRILDGNDALVSEVQQLAWEDERQLREHPSLANHLCDALLYGWREGRHWAWRGRQQDPSETGTHKQQMIARMRRRREDDEMGRIWSDE